MSARDRTVLAIIVVIAAIVGPWVLVIQPRRDQASKLQRQISAQQSQLDAVRAQLSVGAAAQARFAASYTTLVRLGEAVPTTDDTPSLVYQIQAAASASGVDFQSLTSSGSGGALSSAASAPAATASTTGAGGFPTQPFSFTFTGSFFRLASFLGRLQRFVVADNRNQLSVSGRLMTVDSITLGPGPNGFPQMSAAIDATAYLVPSSEGLLNGATPAGPAAPKTQTVSTPSSTSSPPAVIRNPVIR